MRLVMCSICALLALSTTIFAQCIEHNMGPPNPIGGELLGAGVDIASGSEVGLIGAPTQTDSNPDGGSAHVVRRIDGSWAVEQTLSAVDDDTIARFGADVGIEGNVAIVGAPGYRLIPPGAGHGAAYVFRYDGVTWTQEAQLLPPTLATGQNFGMTVDLSGELAVVGGQVAGPFLFRFDGSAWNLEQQLSAGISTNYTSGLSIEGEVVAYGYTGYGQQVGLIAAGTAFIFRFDRTSWVEEQQLVASDAATQDSFGVSIDVATSQDLLIVGAPYSDSPFVNSGAAYIFRYDGSQWVEEAKITPSDPFSTAWFGLSVAIEGTWAAVGAPRDNGLVGAVYLFEFDGSTWIEREKIASPAGPDDFFGHSVCLNGGSSICGANGIGVNPTNAGRAYFLHVDGPDCDDDGVSDFCEIVDGGADCNQNGIADDCDLLAGSSLDCNSNGVPDECDDDCNNNGLPDDCDIDRGSTDCNSNDVPDDCDVASGISADENSNGVPDECEKHFLRGDCNSIGNIGIADAAYLLAVIFQSAISPQCADACDANDDGALDVSDPIMLLGALFLGEPPPPPPWPFCGVDLTDIDNLTCGSYPACP